jgi:carbon-monoxide dehydrogenase large subunit
MASSQQQSSQEQVSVHKQKALVGQRLKRLEDRKFITGSGTYVDDVKFSNGLFAAFVRSPHAHARILKVDLAPALKVPGVVGALDGRAIEGKVANMPTAGPPGAGSESSAVVGAGDSFMRPTLRKVLPFDEVNYAGEAVAVVFAENAYIAEDAAELVEVEYDPLEPVVDVEAAMKPGSPRVHEGFPDNIEYSMAINYGDIDGAFKRADKIVKVSILNQRVHPVSLEPRGIAAVYDAGNDSYTVWLSSQDPNGLRDQLADLILSSAPKVRLIAPDTGGGFGGKATAYPEDVVVCYAAKHFRRPVKWTEGRREHMLAFTHGRGQKQWAELAVRRDGKVLGLKIKVALDGGAYTTEDSTGCPGLTLNMGTGVYDIPAYHAEAYTVFTNKVPHGAYRGAGRPEATYLIERSMNIMAAQLKLDPVKVRRLNYVTKDRFPFKTPGGYTYDSGDYEKNLDKALEVSNYQKLKAEQREARSAGRLVGIGLASWVEICGFGPGSAQTAALTIDKGGNAIITIGGHPHGQGHAIGMAQIVADELGIGIDRMFVRHGDTDMLPWSSVTAGSRSAPLTGSAVLISARKAKEKMRRIATHHLKLPAETRMVFQNGKIYQEGNPGRSIPFDQVAALAYNPEAIPKDMESTIFEYTAFAPPNYTFPFGTHIAEVEVDRETGVVKVLKYFAVDDCGRLLNPMVAEGQVHGGVVQGVGQALLEELIFDDNGQLLTTTLADYCLPGADMMPEIVWERTETPTYANPLGVKGIGEAGTIASTPVIINAVEDALSEYGVTVEKMPVRSDYVLSLIKAGAAAKVSQKKS